VRNSSRKELADFAGSFLFPESFYSPIDEQIQVSIATALFAYAGGDAFGVQYEFKEGYTVESRLTEIADWPLGGVSDDTLLTLLSIESLASENPAFARQRFIDLLKENLSVLRGLGPTTRAAVGLAVKESEQHFIGNSNGAMMRTALLGMAFTSSDDLNRRNWVSEIAQATHSHERAIATSLIASRLFAVLLENPSADIVAVAEAEAKAIGYHDYFSTVFDPHLQISLDPLQTLKAVIKIASTATTVEAAYLAACKLGGDTDTVSALSGALVSLRFPASHGFYSIAWINQVMWSEISSSKSALEIIYRKRHCTVWVVGPVAWDSVKYHDGRTIERPGGTGANVAIALATTGTEVDFVSYLGDENLSAQLDQHLKSSQIHRLYMPVIAGPPSHVAIPIAADGERTIVVISDDKLDQVSLIGKPIKSNDIIVFVIWRSHFIADLEFAHSAGALTVVGSAALTDPDVKHADYLIGSRDDFTGNYSVEDALNRFTHIVVTDGARGATLYGPNGSHFQPAHNVEVVDTTGAGDAFLSGLLHYLALHGELNADAMAVAAQWSALTVSTEGSIPPRFA
jgi:sugar/nucleoside kinase (ribokinase family)/ADP-ribosylglycohydrolase